MVASENVATSKAIQQRTGRTFHVATRLLPERVRNPTYVLYAFFRVADDVVVLDRAFPHRAVRARHANCGVLLFDFASFVVLWGVVALAFGNWVPLLVAAVLGSGIAVAERRRSAPAPTR